MKKILLSSIIMLGVCGAANAQTGKFKKNETATSTSAAAPANPATEVRTAADKQAAQTVAPVSLKTKEQHKSEQTTLATQPASGWVNAAGVVPTNEENDKAIKAKAAAQDVKKAN